MISGLVSIIIANYNNGRYLRQCLDSVVMQTYRDIEIIVADDKSTDDSFQIINEYQQKYKNIIAVYNEKNLGVTRNRHNAILKSNGEFITTLDADDYYINNDKIKNEIELILEYRTKFKKDIIAYSNTFLVTHDGCFIATIFDEIVKKPQEGNVLLSLLQRIGIPKDIVFLRKIYDLVGGYDVKIQIHEDYDLDIRMANYCEFYYTGQHGTAYRQTTTGLSSAGVKKHYKWQLYILNKNRHLITDKKIFCEVRNRLKKAFLLYHINRFELTKRLYRFAKKFII